MRGSLLQRSPRRLSAFVFPNRYHLIARFHPEELEAARIRRNHDSWSMRGEPGDIWTVDEYASGGLGTDKHRMRQRQDWDREHYWEYREDSRLLLLIEYAINILIYTHDFGGLLRKR